MRVLSFLFSFALALALVVSELTFVIDRTVSVATIDGAATSSGFYAAAAPALPAFFLDGNAAGRSIEEAQRKKIAAAITETATPEFLRRKLLDIGGQFEEMLKADRDSVTADFSELADGLRVQGIRWPAEDFRGVLAATQIDPLVKAVHLFESIKLAGFIASVGLLIANLALAVTRRRYGALGRSFVYVGILNIVIAAALFTLTAPLLQNAPLLWQKLVAVFIRSLEMQFGLIAAVALLLGATCIIFTKKQGESPSIKEKSAMGMPLAQATSVAAGFPRSTLIVAGLAILLAATGSYFAIEQHKKPAIRVFQPSGPIVEVPNAFLLRGSSDTVITPTPFKISTSQIVESQRALSLRPQDAETVNNAGVLFAGIGQVEEGNRLLAEALEHAPGNPVINYNYARGLYQEGRLKEAIRYSDAAIRLRPEFDEARLLRADAAVREGDYDGAEETLKLLKKGLAIALLTDGVIKLSKRKVQDGLNDFQQALTLAPNDAIALYNSGVAQQMQNNLSAAENFYRQAIAGGQAPPEAHDNLGVILAQGGDTAAALQEFRQAVFLRPDRTFRDHLRQLSQQVTSLPDANLNPPEAKKSLTPAGYTQMPPADRTAVGLGAVGAGTLTVTNNSNHILEFVITGPTTTTRIIPAYLTNTINVAEGQYKLVGRSVDDPKIRPFYGSEFYRATEHYSLELVVRYLRPAIPVR